VVDITTLKEEFWKGFDIVVGGLDSLTVRRWMSGMLLKIAKSGDGKIIPYIDGASEVFIFIIYLFICLFFSGSWRNCTCDNPNNYSMF
jgi:molybdopterin/thiamine biosynthesis adenylyltransferase